MREYSWLPKKRVMFFLIIMSSFVRLPFFNIGNISDHSDKNIGALFAPFLIQNDLAAFVKPI
ncbi:hypothetical protein GCM10011409_34300 [Lentibacillus populi]|uniref:Uncharacterized protein n=1 Tax=Lentibacillus populi TaxID=1827502 RepID=A0A9W5U020_9BACI|nr:hypothetical protein GCM10011409_34300 [Lentibacillus populi]